MKLIIASIMALAATLPMEWKLNFSEAKSEAQTAHKMILLNFSGSDWCGPCIKLKHEVFESPEFEQFASESLVLVRADFPRQKKNQLPKDQVAQNEILADKYNKKGIFPLTVLIDNTGKIIKEWEGYQVSPAAFLADVRNSSGK